MRILVRTMLAACFAATMLLAPPAAATTSENAAWDAVRAGGHVVLIRHALAPGMGDPPEFTLGDCSTQRNLSDAGRDQARRIGDLFRANGVEAAEVFSSEWCRCMETAELLDLGATSPLPALNSFFEARRRREPQTRAVKQWLAGLENDGVVVLVTHQVNISALAGRSTRSGELVVVRPDAMGDVTVVGAIETD